MKPNELICTKLMICIINLHLLSSNVFKIKCNISSSICFVDFYNEKFLFFVVELIDL